MATVTIRLYDPNDPKFAPLTWDNIANVETTFLNLDEGKHPQIGAKVKKEKEQQQGNVKIEGLNVEVKKETLVGVKVEVTYANETTVSCPLTAISLEPKSECTCDVAVPAAQPQTETTTYIIHGHWCEHHGEKHERKGKANIARAWATLVSTTGPNGPVPPAQGDRVHFDATIQEGAAYLSVPAAASYDLYVESHERRARSQTEATRLSVCCPGEHVIDFCLEPCQGIVSLQFFDSCGHPVTGVEPVVDGKPYKTDSPNSSTVTLPAEKAGTRRIWFPNYDVSPKEFHVHEHVTAQAFAFQLTQKSVIAPRPLEVEEDDEKWHILDFEGLGDDAEPSVEVWTTSGVLVTKLKPDASGKFRHPVPQPKQTLVFKAFNKGKEIGRTEM
jgi:hypothetical protein